MTEATVTALPARAAEVGVQAGGALRQSGANRRLPLVGGAQCLRVLSVVWRGALDDDHGCELGASIPALINAGTRAWAALAINAKA
jgi:hypothetical protein